MSETARPISGTRTLDPVEFSERFAQIQKRIMAAGDTANGPVTEKLALLKSMSEFDYGRHLLVNGGLNGRWSHYAFYEYPILKAAGRQFHPLEERLLNTPGLRSHRERLGIARSLIQ